ncbi:MAG: histone-like protein, partial [Candidatus Thorarchaeota archaeon]|jgi:histone H3/H4
LAKGFGFIIPNGGVLPNIHSELLDESKAVGDIRKYQKGTGLLLSGNVFHVAVNNTAREYTHSPTVVGAAMSALQHYVEKKVVEMLGMANRVTLNAKRKTVTQEDIRLVFVLTNFCTDRGNGETFSKVDIKKLVARAGVKKLAKAAFENVNFYINGLISNVIRDALVYTEHRREKQVTLEDMSKSLKGHGAVMGGHGTTAPEPEEVEEPEDEESSEEESEEPEASWEDGEEGEDWEWEYY